MMSSANGALWGWIGAHPIITLLIAVNIAAFAIMGIDKLLSMCGFIRVPEKILFALATVFGAFGALAAMLLFRHKTRNPKFFVGFIVLALVQAAIIYFVIFTDWNSVLPF